MTDKFEVEKFVLLEEGDKKTEVLLIRDEGLRKNFLSFLKKTKVNDEWINDGLIQVEMEDFMDILDNLMDNSAFICFLEKEKQVYLVSDELEELDKIKDKIIEIFKQF